MPALAVSFGRAVQALQFRRRTLSAKLLWSPLPDGWEVKGVTLPDAGSKTLQIPHAVAATPGLADPPGWHTVQRGLETYTREVLAFPQPDLGR